MSGKRIVEVLDLCEHGHDRAHSYIECGRDHPPHKHDLSNPGGCFYTTCSLPYRRTLTEGQYVLIEKVDGEWPEWAEERLSDPPLYGLSPAAQQSLGMDGEAVKVKPRYILDALSDHTEGET